MPNLDELQELGRHVDVSLSDAILDDVSDLILRIHQARVRRVGGLLTPLMARSYAQHTAAERQGMRSAVIEVIKALVLLDLIELPK